MPAIDLSIAETLTRCNAGRTIYDHRVRLRGTGAMDKAWTTPSAASRVFGAQWWGGLGDRWRPGCHRVVARRVVVRPQENIALFESSEFAR